MHTAVRLVQLVTALGTRVVEHGARLCSDAVELGAQRVCLVQMSSVNALSVNGR